MKKVAVVLSGCGHIDGSEITEAVSLIVSLYQAGAQVQCFAPNLEVSTFNHLTRTVTEQKHNVLNAAARISRGQVLDLDKLDAQDFDALAIPGGMGAAKILSQWAEKQAKAQVLPALQKAILDFHSQSKPIAAICIAPAILALVLGKFNVTLTIGEDSEIAKEIEKTGAQHVACPVDDYVSDRETKVVTSPAYMYDLAKPHEVFAGISKLAHELVEWA